MVTNPIRATTQLVGISAYVELLLKSIHAGNLDSHLDSIAFNVRERKAEIARDALNAVRPGQVVTLSQTIKPTYLRGMQAVVKKVNGASVVIDIDANPAYGRFSGARNVRVPAACIQH
jgi:uncharacterized protein YkvS